MATSYGDKWGKKQSPAANRDRQEAAEGEHQASKIKNGRAAAECVNNFYTILVNI
jgi:hypothetical protein